MALCGALRGQAPDLVRLEPRHWFVAARSEGPGPVFARLHRAEHNGVLVAVDPDDGSCLATEPRPRAFGRVPGLVTLDADSIAYVHAAFSFMVGTGDHLAVPPRITARSTGGRPAGGAGRMYLWLNFR